MPPLLHASARYRRQSDRVPVFMQGPSVRIARTSHRAGGPGNQWWGPGPNIWVALIPAPRPAEGGDVPPIREVTHQVDMPGAVGEGYSAAGMLPPSVWLSHTPCPLPSQSSNSPLLLGLGDSWRFRQHDWRRT